MLLILVFTVFPLFFSLGISLFKWNVVQPAEFVGLNNYRRLVADEEFTRSMANTLKFVIGYVPGTMLASFVLAYLLSLNLKGRGIYRTVYYFPHMVSGIAIAEVWLWIYEPRFGLLNFYLGKLGLPSNIGWLADPRFAMWAIVIMSIWQSLGYYMLLYLSGLLNIDRSLYEAAEIDGAGAWARVRHITVPLIMPVTFFIMTMLIIGAFQVFGPIYVMTQGGPMHSTDVIIYTIYQSAFNRFRMGYASAQAYILGMIMLAITLIQWRFWGRSAVTE